MVVREGPVPPDEWHALAAGAPLAASPPWLRSVAARAQGPGRWFILRDDTGTPVAGLYGTVAETEATDDAFNLYDVLTGEPRTMPLTDDERAGRAALRAASPPRAAWFPNLVLTLPSAECVPVGPGATDRTVVRHLIGAIVQWATEQGMVAVAALYVRRRHTALTEALTASAFTSRPVSATAELHLPGTGFDDYLASLSKQRRRSARVEEARVRAAGVRIERRPLAEMLDRLVELRVEAKRKYGRTPNPEKERRSFEALAAELGDRLHLLVAEVVADGKVIGFGLDVVVDGVWHGIVNGIAHDDPRTDSVAFALDYYEPIRAAYRLGVREMQFGMAAWETKRNRGCTLVPLDGFVLPLDVALAPTVAAASGASRFTA